MIKRIRTLSFVLALLMLSLFVLAGCDSSDYSKAMDDYNSGNYSEALSAFNKLGDYEDSKDFALRCKWALLAKYIEENGERDSKIGGTVIQKTAGEMREKVYIKAESNDHFVVGLKFDAKESLVTNETDMTIDVIFGRSSSNWDFYSHLTVQFGAASTYIDEKISGEVNINEIDSSTSFKSYIDDFYYEAKDASGKITTSNNISDSISGVDKLVEKWKIIAKYLPQLLEETELNITAGDLGFTKL